MTQNDPQVLIGKLYEYGHFFNPVNPNGHNVSESHLGKLTLNDAVVKEAVRSWQDWNQDEIDHVRWTDWSAPSGKIDGIPGRAFESTIMANRCGCPDYPNPREATGSGGWLKCDPERSDVHSIRVNLNTSRCPDRVRQYLARSLEASVRAYANIGLAVRYIFDGEPLEAEIEKEWKPLPGGTIGWNQFPPGNTCNGTITGKLDTAWTPEDWVMFALLEIHETGHGVGLKHTRGGIMNPSIIRTEMSWRNDPSFRALQRMYGGEPISADPTDPTDPTEPSPIVGLEGELETFAGRVVKASELKRVDLTQGAWRLNATANDLPPGGIDWPDWAKR